MSRQLGHLNVKEGAREEAEVIEVTKNHKVLRYVVNLKNHICDCREWQFSGKPCPHALAEILRWKTTCILTSQSGCLDLHILV
jgi:hypothetical protein